MPKKLTKNSPPKVKDLHLANLIGNIVNNLAHCTQVPREAIQDLQDQVAELREATGEPEPDAAE